MLEGVHEMQTKLKSLIQFLVIIQLSLGFSQDDFTEDGDSGKITNISGVVIDASTGKVVAGANVIVEGTDLGSAADEDGRYIIEGLELVQVLLPQL